jgi:hypothetical protein
MLLLNFSHPLSEVQLSAIEAMLSQKISQKIDCQVYFDNQHSFLQQVRDLFSSGALPVKAIETEPVLVNLPSHSFIAALILVELHGRIGHFPAIIRIGPAPERVPVIYQVSEIVDLQTLRDESKRANISSED